MMLWVLEPLLKSGLVNEFVSATTVADSPEEKEPEIITAPEPSEAIRKEVDLEKQESRLANKTGVNGGRGL